MCICYVHKIVSSPNYAPVSHNARVLQYRETFLYYTSLIAVGALTQFLNKGCIYSHTKWFDDSQKLGPIFRTVNIVADFLLHTNPIVLRIKCPEYSVHWGTRWCSSLRHRATRLKVPGSMPNGVNGIFHSYNLSGHTMALGLTRPLTQMSTRNISWEVKVASM